MNELPPNWLHQTLENSKAMNAQEQIQERATAAMKALFFIPWNKDRIEAEFVKQLTAQQTADAASHREVVERLEDRIEKLEQQEEIVEAAIPGGEFEGSEDTNGEIVATIVSQRDTARAESAKLREVLGVAMESLSHYRKGDDHAAGEEVIAAAAHFEEGDKLRTITLALAATVLKEGKVSNDPPFDLQLFAVSTGDGWALFVATDSNEPYAYIRWPWMKDGVEVPKNERELIELGFDVL